MPKGQKATGKKPAKKLATQQSLNGAIKSICDVMRRSNCAGALQYVPELTWILFLRILDEREAQEAAQAAAVGGHAFTPSLGTPYRWQDWAAPEGPKRKQLKDAALGEFFAFVNGELIPHLKKLRERPNATPRQKVISEIFSGVERTRIDTERNFQDVLDKVHEISAEAVNQTHVFTLSQVYEGLLLKMGEKGNDGGQFFTPREIIRAMVQVMAPKCGETVYDPCCGTGGFLAQTYEYMRDQGGPAMMADQLETLKHGTFYGREKENLVYPIALANLVLHGIDQPNLWHGNTLTNQETYGGLFHGAPAAFNVILTNPPFGGKEGKEAQTHFPFKTGATQVLFLQHIINNLAKKGRCAMVIDEGVLFRTNETAFVQTKRKLLDDCDLWCIISLPGGVFTAAGAGVKTNLLFFTKGKHTEKIWYYDLSDIKVGKKTPFTRDNFDEFFKLMSKRGDSDKSWTVDLVARRATAAKKSAPLKKEADKLEKQATEIKEEIAQLKKDGQRGGDKITKAECQCAELSTQIRELRNKVEAIENAVYDLKAVNPNTDTTGDTRTPAELLDTIEARAQEIAVALARLRSRWSSQL